MISEFVLNNKKVGKSRRDWFIFFYKKNSSFCSAFAFFLECITLDDFSLSYKPIVSRRIFLSYLLFSIFCVQKMQQIYFSTPKSLENQLEWLPFSRIIVGPHNLRHPPITCHSSHNLPFFGHEKTSYVKK